MTSFTGVSGNVSADYQTLQSMYKADGNNISDDAGAKQYAEDFAKEASQQGDTNEAGKAEAAETGQTNVDFNGGAKADKIAGEEKAQGAQDTVLSKTADELDKAGNHQGATDLRNAEAGNDQNTVKKIIKENADVLDGSSDGVDSKTALQAVDVKSLQNDLKSHAGEVNNDIKNFKKDGGTNDELTSMGLPTAFIGG